MSDCDDDLVFRINTKFAENYDKWRRKEELQKLKDRYGEDLSGTSSSSSEEEDEDAEALTAQIEKDFLKTLSYVKSKDPRIYNKETTFYHDQDDSSSEDTASQKKKQKGKKNDKEKPVFIKDYERTIITEKGGRYSDDDDDDNDDYEGQARAASPTYIQEQEIIKQSFQKVLEKSDSDESDDDQLLKRRAKTQKEKKQEEDDHIQWMKGQKETIDDEKSAQDAAEMEALKKYWTDPSLEEGEKFLRDFILNKGYMDKREDDDDLEVELEEAEFSEEERLLDAQDEFERKYNFRFEEPDTEFIKRYPRTMANSVRVKDNKRAVKRQDRKERKLQEKERKKEDLKQLKNLKKQEILDKLEKLRQATGNANVGFDDLDLEGDFDPEEHDKAMQKVFNEDYDGLGEDETKPEFEHEDWEEENWDNWDGHDHKNEENYQEEDDVYCEDPDFNMDADYDPTVSKQANKERKAALQQELIGASSKKRKKKMSKFAEALQAKKPVFDPNDKTFEQYIDEYYRLDYEDMIDDMPCRFKYRKVISNDFGLSVDEILSAKERELNQWASLKKTCQYRNEEEEEKDKKFFSKKGKNEAKKRRVFLSIYGKSSDSEDSEDETTKKKQKSSKAVNKSSVSKTKKAQEMFSLLKQASTHKNTQERYQKSSTRQDSDGKQSSQTVSTDFSEFSDSRSPDETSSEGLRSKKSKKTVKITGTRKESDTLCITNIDNSHRSLKIVTTQQETEKSYDFLKLAKNDHATERTFATKMEKQNRKRTFSEDSSNTSDRVEHFSIQNQQDIKPNVNPIAATKNNDNSNRTKRKKRKRNIKQEHTDSDEDKLKTSANSELSSETHSKTRNTDFKNRKRELKTSDHMENSNKLQSPQSSDHIDKQKTNLESSFASSENKTSKKKKKRKLKTSEITELDTSSEVHQSSSSPERNQKKFTKSGPSKPSSVKLSSEHGLVLIRQKPKKKRRKKQTQGIGSVSGKLVKIPMVMNEKAMNNQTPSTKLPSPAKKPLRKVEGNKTSPTPAESKSKQKRRTQVKNRNRRLAKKGLKPSQGSTGAVVSDARLKAYGINPKKHGYRMKYLREQEAKKQKPQNPTS